MEIDTAFSIFLGATALLVTLVLHLVRGIRERTLIEANLREFTRNSEKALTQVEDLLKKAERLTVGHQMRPELSIYLANQWKFVEKTFHSRFEKHSICERIVERYILEGSSVLLDSGSTVDLVTSELLSSPLEDIHVYSNNVFAAIHLVGAKKITLHLFEGIFNDRFAATYSTRALDALRDLHIRVFVVAATAFRFDLGVMVDRNDEDNATFKAAVFDAFRKESHSTLVIAVDAEKFVEPTQKHQSVIGTGKWAELLAERKGDIVVVTYPMRSDAPPASVVEFKQELSRFRSAGVRVDALDA